MIDLIVYQAGNSKPPEPMKMEFKQETSYYNAVVLLNDYV